MIYNVLLTIDFKKYQYFIYNLFPVKLHFYLANSKFISLSCLFLLRIMLIFLLFLFIILAIKLIDKTNFFNLATMRFHYNDEI